MEISESNFSLNKYTNFWRYNLNPSNSDMCNDSMPKRSCIVNTICNYHTRKLNTLCVGTCTCNHMLFMTSLKDIYRVGGVF